MRSFFRVLLGLALVVAGTSHLTFARKEFTAQVPDFVPLDDDTTVLASGVAEITLGSALFFTVIFPGNLSQWVNRRDAFGLDSDEKRFVRLFGQPVLIALALWSTRGRRS